MGRSFINASIAFGLIVIVLGLIAGYAPNTAQAQAPEAQDVCIARWEWHDQGQDAEAPYWSAPFPASRLGNLDLRSITEQGTAGGLGGWGIFTYDQPMGSTGMHCLGGDMDAPMTEPQAGTIAIMLGLDARDFAARDMRGIIAEILLEQGDPTGQDRWKPIQTTRRGATIHLGGYGQIYGEPFSANSQATQNTLDIRWADYRRQKDAGVPLEQLQAQTGFDGFRIFGREPTPADIIRLLPPESRSDGHRCGADEIGRCTTISDSFDTADSDTLGPGLTWTELAATDIDIVSNAAETVTNSGYARAESDLAGSDMYAEATTQNSVSTSNRGAGPCIRYATAADTAYWLRGIGTSFQDYRIQSRVAAVNTEISMIDGFTDAQPGLLRIEVVGSNLEIFYEGVSRDTVTSTTITGNTRAGICSLHNGANRARFSDFEAGDIGAPPGTRRVIRVN